MKIGCEVFKIMFLKVFQLPRERINFFFENGNKVLDKLY